MHYRPLGRTGIQVSPFALGAMMFSSFGNGDQADVDRMVGRALDAGINFVDTADAYRESEEMVGRALKGRRDEVVLASKFARPLDDDVNHRGGSRRWIMTAVENSLRKLQTDHLDVYQMHRPDPGTDIEETLSALTDLVRSGKVRAIAVTTPQRWPGAPEIPTVAESGLPGYEVSGWFGLLAPAGTPPAVLATIQQALSEAVKQPEVNKQMLELGAQPVANTPDAFAKLVQADVAKWRDVVKTTGVKLD